MVDVGRLTEEQSKRLLGQLLQECKDEDIIDCVLTACRNNKSILSELSYRLQELEDALMEVNAG